MKVGAELLDDGARLPVAGRSRTEVVVAAECEDADRVSIGHAPGRARLVVPVAELDGGGDRADDGAWVSVAPGDEDAPPTVIEWGLEQGPGVDDSQVDFAVGRRRRVTRLTSDHGPRGVTVGCGSCTRIKIDVIDERRMDDPFSDTDVEEKGHADAVHQVGVVRRRSPADVEVRETAHHGDDAGQRFDCAKGVSECARHLTHVSGGERRLTNLVALSVHIHLLGDFEDDRRSRGRWRRRDSRGTGWARIARGLLLVELHLCAYARGYWHDAPTRRTEPPREDCAARLVGEWVGAFGHDRVRHVTVLVDVDVENDGRVALSAGRIRHVRAALHCGRRHRRIGSNRRRCGRRSRWGCLGEGPRRQRDEKTDRGRE